VFIMFGILLLTVLFIILWYTGNRGMQTSLQESDHKYKVAGYLQEIARTAYSYKFGRNSTAYINTTDEHVTNYLKARTSHFKVLLFQYWTLISFKVIIIAAMLIVGSLLLVGQELNIGQFIAAEMVVMLVIDSVEKLIVNLDKVYDVLTSVEKINKLLEKPLEKTGSAHLADSRKGISVDIRDLSFGFEPGQRLLSNINLQINAGEKICVNGINGSGKSTLIKVIAGVYPEFNGIILVDDISLSSYDLRKLRSHIGMLFHSQDIIDATIKENICLGDSTITHQQLNALAEIVGLKEFIQSDQAGYDRQLHPSGQHLPARTVKKILLMRALIHKPKMLLLEEPWLGLEDTHAARIKEYLLKEIPDTTVITVTNDAFFAEQCHKAVVMSRGTISEIKKNKA